MHSLEQRERALNMFIREGKTSGEIARELSMSRNTIKSWVHRYETQQGKPVRTDQYRGQLFGQKCDKIKVRRSYKQREKSTKQTAEERIAQLEMEVDLLRNFLLETERR